MKKLLFISALAITIAGCTKETMKPAASSGENSSIETQVADLIQKADPELYSIIYTNNPGSRAPKPSIKIIHGIFVILNGDPASGTCFPNPNCVCSISITWPAFVTDSTEVSDITGNYYVEYTEPGEGEIIMNDSVPYTIHDLSSVDVKFDEGIEGQSVITCTVLE